VIVTDTVGFIRDLPEDLARAFAATLEELDQADLLLHVADASNPQVEDQIAAVDKIMDDLDLSDAPRLLVLNKMDRTSPERLEMLSNRFGGVAASALKPKSLHPLLQAIEALLFKRGNGLSPQTTLGSKNDGPSVSLPGPNDL
jgi:GTPase